MKIKRYTAVSMRAALAQVRAEQGPDAVILSTRRGDEGIEVIAAVDYDEALFVDANRQRAAPPVMPVSIIAPPAAPAARRPAGAPAMPQRMTQRPSAAADAGYGAMQRELQDLRLLLQT